MTHITTRYHVDVPGLGNHLDSHRYSRDVQNWSPSYLVILGDLALVVWVLESWQADQLSYHPGLDPGLFDDQP